MINMQNNVLKLLLLSHSSSVTGAPLIACSIAGFLAGDADLSVDMVFLSGQKSGDGSCLPRIRNTSRINIYVINWNRVSTIVRQLESIILSVLRLIGLLCLRYRFGICKSFKYDVIYANSIVSLEAGALAKRATGGKLVLHIHEMRYWILKLSKVPSFYKDLDSVDLVIAPSHRCIRDLETICGGKLKSALVIVPEPASLYINQPAKCDLTSDEAEVVEFLNNAKSNRFKVIVSIGSDSWRKGRDHFINIAHYLQKYDQHRFKFLWISDRLTSLETERLIIETDMLGLHENIFFAPPVSNVKQILELSSCYLLTSREDPMPITVLEAMSVGVPVLAFKNTSGFSELLHNSQDQLADYPDVQSFARKCCAILNDSILRSDIIQTQYEIVEKCSGEKFHDSILKIIRASAMMSSTDLQGPTYT
jgi:glycosyltransferase involved in cell wall biosynthesis